MNATDTRTTTCCWLRYAKSALWLMVAGGTLKGATLPDLDLLPHSVALILDAGGMVAGVWIVAREMPRWRPT